MFLSPIFGFAGTKQITDNDFIPADYKSAAVLAPIVASLDSRLCDYTMYGFIMWARYFKNEFAMLTDHCAILRGHMDGRSIYSYISSEDVTAEEHYALLEFALQRDGELCFFPISAHDAEYIKAALGEPGELTKCDFWYDYVYDIDDLINLSGGRYHGQKNHLNRFLALYPDHAATPISFADIPEIIEFMRSFEPDGSAFGVYEHEATVEALTHYDALHSHGLVLRIDGRVAAFTVGEVRGKTLFVHIEKADKNIRGAYQFINNAFAKHIKERFPSVTEVNREDDADDEGLRRAKESLHPVELIYKYRMVYAASRCTP